MITPEQYIPLTRKEALSVESKFYNTGIACKRNHIANRYSYSGQCVECAPIVKAVHRSTAKYKETDRAYYQKNKSKIKNNQKLSRYKISQSQFDDLLLSQNGKCGICKIDLALIKACIDHCHTTGKVRGILCIPCNSGIGMFRDKIETLKSAIEYLKI